MCDKETKQEYTEVCTEEVGDLADEQPKTQYILNENGELTEILKSECKPVEYPVKYKLTSAFEVFVRVNNTDNYWISNYGRLINNLMHKDKSKFYEHRSGNHHNTIFEIEKRIISFPTSNKKGKVYVNRKKRCMERNLGFNVTDEQCNEALSEIQAQYDKRVCEIEVDRWKRETFTDELVAQHFLVPNDGKKVWHKDGNRDNLWYKNLIYVTNEQFSDLEAGVVTWQELDIKQEYIEYENKALGEAYRRYYGLCARCKPDKDIDKIGRHYKDVTMCKEWEDDPKSFVKWFMEHYYTCEGEQMDIDKDLFGDGTHVYSPETCCILPKKINAFLSNCTRRRDTKSTLPKGIKYNSRYKKYYATIQCADTGIVTKLSEWDTPEEAFAEYKMVKEADLILMAVKYKDRIPEYIYKRLLSFEVKPY